MKIPPKAAALLACLGAIHLIPIFAGFLSPYDFASQNRSLPYAPPTHLHFRDAGGNIRLRPLVCSQTAIPDGFAKYEEDLQNCSPVFFFVRGNSYTIAGTFQSNVHLFGVEQPATIFLLGTDFCGRDVFTRLLYGSQLSLLSGLLATALALSLGGLLGTVSGYFGGWLDTAIMRSVDLFLALPWLYLLFAARAFMPLHTPPARTFLLIIAIIAVVGWARPARLVRGIVLTGKERHYVMAARLFGGSDLYLMRRHILPQTYNLIVTQATILIPQYILVETVLSFLGLGLSEPVPSWGNMLATLQEIDVMSSYWWMWAPGIALIVVSTFYLMLASVMQNSCGAASHQ